MDPKADKRRGTLMQAYAASTCQGCPLKALCTKANVRTLWRHHNQAWRDAYRKKMESPMGKQRLRQRMALVEHPFGTLKDRMGHTPLLVRGLQKVAAEVSLYVLGYNLTRLSNLASFSTIKTLIQKHDWKVEDTLRRVQRRLLSKSPPKTG